ncbi:52 kDa repressor of the inhibitor of the protein kinase-like [Clytia hemisphaerica]|uniref:52 kDa repressor of the inhibitor of the protein kinase-like n=1 Tax=Clytia hemisphaerica TaxID=252671 RepID=UPI0034D70FB3
MRCWKMATTKIKQHFNNNHGALEDFKNLTVAVTDPSRSIDVTANRLVSALVQRNREMIRPIIATLICLGKCNLAIRGHRDDSKYYLGENTSNSCGNFLSILKLVLQFAPPALKELVMKCPKNATYKSKTIQNQIIDVIKSYIQGKIVEKIKIKRVFSVLADEATDVSNKEQMALVLRYLSQNNVIKEEFVNFIHCKNGTTGQALSEIILDEVKALGLDFENVRGQGYDGAGAMAGSEKGVASRILRIHRLAVYIHCFAHRLNLSIMKVSNITLVRDVFDHTRVIADFFTNSPKRAEFLEHIFSELDGIVRKLINICRTRWVARILGVNRIVESYFQVHKTFSKIAQSGATFHNVKWDAKTQTKANGCRAKMETFAWLVALVITKNIFFYIDSITTGLQASSLSIVEAYLEISNVIETLKGVKLNVDHYHHLWYTEAVELAAKIGINPKCPRVISGNMKHRDGTPASTEEEYFRRTITVKCLNEVLNDLQERFDANSIGVIDGFYCIPSVMAVKDDWKIRLRKFMHKYRTDMPKLHSAESEIERWENTWLKNSNEALPSTIEDTMKKMLTTMFPNIYQVLVILAVSLNRRPILPIGLLNSVWINFPLRWLLWWPTCAI